jgi:hypothetical protein
VRFNLANGFYPFADVHRHMRRDVNAAAVSKLTQAQKDEISRRCEAAIARRGYRAPPPPPDQRP